MINELEHIKVSLAELPAVDSTDQWLKYQFAKADSAWIIFAMETRDGGPWQWRRVHGSSGLCGLALYGEYKKGAAWEIHSQQRLLRGKKVKVERYLAELNNLPVTQLSELGAYRPQAKKTVVGHGLEYIDSYFGHRWDKSQWTPLECEASFQMELNSRENFVFLSQVNGPSEIYLTKETETPLYVPSSNLELFA